MYYYNKMVQVQQKWCPGCKAHRVLADFYNNKRRYDGKQSNCKCCMKRHNKVNYSKHKVSWNKRSTAYRKTAKWKEYKKNYMNKRYKDSKEFRILTRLRNRTREAVRKYHSKKKKTTIDYLGCSIEQLCSYLESLFYDDMCWDNVAKWDIDHKVPCSSFDLSKESDRQKCFHYTNLQPMWRLENIKKSNKLISTP